MNDRTVTRNRHILGTLLAIQKSPPGEYDLDRFVNNADDFFESPGVSAFSLLLAARLVGESAKVERGFGPRDMIGLGLPAAASEDPDILNAFRLAVVIMNNDVATAQALVETITQSRSRSQNVLACLVGMLMEAPPP